MAFAGRVWRLLVGIKDALALIFLLLFFFALFALLSGRPSPAAVREGALLLDLDGSVVEELSVADPLTAIMAGSAPVNEYRSRDLVRAIDEAATDKRIKAVALDLSTFTGGGQVHMQAIGEALERFRKTGKPVLTYAVLYSDDALHLAAHASEVWVDPLGGAAITGPGGANLYYAGLLEKLKVTAHVFRVGTYKSAIEPYTRSDMSPEARENAEALYGSLWSEWQANVKRARPRMNIARATTDIPAWLAENNQDLALAAIEAGLVDRSGTQTEWHQRLAKIAGEDEWDESPDAFAKTELDSWLAEIEPPADGKTIGVITVAGLINDTANGPGEAGSRRIVKLLDDALEQDLAALVVRVDSPGGSVTGSEDIRRAILRHKARNIPVVVSMANVAASGGYWVSTPAERIFAEPETVTGSIGIFGIVPSFERTLADWGVTSDGVRTTPLSGQPDPLSGFSPETEAMMQASVDAGYGRFLNLVAQSRGISRQRADELGQGRVWDGGSARQMGLVDQFGGLEDALEYAADRAGLKKRGAWHAEFLGGDVDPFTAMIGQFFGDEEESAPAGDILAQFARHEQGVAGRLLADLGTIMGAGGLQVRCLECPVSSRPPDGSGETAGNSLLRLMASLLQD